MSIKDVDLSERVEETRDKTIDKVKIYDLDEIEEAFDEQVKLINKNMILACKEYNKDQEDIHDSITCSQIVLIESFFDYFCHIVYLYGIKQIYDGNWARTSKYEKIMIPIGIVSGDNFSFDGISSFISEKNSSETFLSYKKFDDSFKTIHDSIISDLAKDLYSNLLEHERIPKLKKDISEIYKIRNEIVHQACKDRKTGENIHISRDDVTEYISKIKKMISSILKIIKAY